MIESPVLQELRAEWTRETTCKDVARFLAARFGVEANRLESEMDGIADDLLNNLVELAATSPDIESFRKHLNR